MPSLRHTWYATLSMRRQVSQSFQVAVRPSITHLTASAANCVSRRIKYQKLEWGGEKKLRGDRVHLSRTCSYCSARRHMSTIGVSQSLTLRRNSEIFAIRTNVTNHRGPCCEFAVLRGRTFGCSLCGFDYSQMMFQCKLVLLRTIESVYPSLAFTA